MEVIYYTGHARHQRQKEAIRSQFIDEIAIANDRFVPAVRSAFGTGAEVARGWQRAGRLGRFHLKAPISTVPNSPGAVVAISRRFDRKFSWSESFAFRYN
jgi:hypothetical protein